MAAAELQGGLLSSLDARRFAPPSCSPTSPSSSTPISSRFNSGLDVRAFCRRTVNRTSEQSSISISAQTLHGDFLGKLNTFRKIAHGDSKKVMMSPSLRRGESGDVGRAYCSAGLGSGENGAVNGSGFPGEWGFLPQELSNGAAAGWIDATVKWHRLRASEKNNVATVSGAKLSKRGDEKYILEGMSSREDNGALLAGSEENKQYANGASMHYSNESFQNGGQRAEYERWEADSSECSVQGNEHKMLAAVDMGTNSFHMVVVRADSQGRFQIEDVEKEDVRLGSGSSGFSIITPEAEERALAALKRLKKIAANRRASMRVVATSAVREARNKRAFTRKIYETTGLEVEVLTGREEACLIYAGVLQALPVFNKTVLTVDIGGGSTEFVVGRYGKPLFATSLKLGHIRLTERFVGAASLSRTQLEDMRRYIRVMLADSGVMDVVHKSAYEIAIGSSGTIETIEQMIHHSRVNNPTTTVSLEGVSGQKSKQSLHSKSFTKDELTTLVKKICKAKTPEVRAKIPGLPEKRADVIVGGAILLEEIFSAMGVEEMMVSPYALREGVIVDTLARTCDAYCPTPNLRRSSVLNLAKRFNVDRRMESALHSAKLALEILAGLQTCRMGGTDCMTEAVQRLEGSDMEVLEAATILHYVGMFISHKGYHKHSHYLIKNNEHLLGFTPMEIEMIALLAKYHRKKVPTTKDEEFAELPDEVQKRLRALCAVIRIAVALDRCDSGAVEKVHVLQDHDSCVLAIKPAVDEATNQLKDVSLEIWAARVELEYFEKIFKRRASIVVADQPDVDNLETDASPSLSS